MSERIPEDRLSELLDGRLGPEEAQALEGRVAHRPELAHDLAVWREIVALLDTPLDVEPPADLTSGILAAVRLDREQRAKLLRLPVRLEQAFVLAGAAVLAVFAAALVRAVQAPAGGALLGDAAVGAGNAVGILQTAAVTAVGSVIQLDWTLRLLQTLAGAGRTALDSSATVLVVTSLVAMGITGIAAYVLTRGTRRGGLGHASLLA